MTYASKGTEVIESAHSNCPCVLRDLGACDNEGGGSWRLLDRLGSDAAGQQLVRADKSSRPPFGRSLRFAAQLDRSAAVSTHVITMMESVYDFLSTLIVKTAPFSIIILAPVSFHMR